MTSILRQLRQAVGFNPVAWVRSVPRMRQLVREAAGDGPAGAGRPRCLVIVTPWEGTSIPWFSLGVGLMLSAEGAEVTFAVDDQSFGPNPLRHWMIVQAIRRVMKTVAERHRVIHLSALQPDALDDAAEAEVDRLARLNTTWALRGEMLQKGRKAFEAKRRKQIGAAYGRISAVFRNERFDMVFVPGGVYGTSGLWTLCARAAGIRVGTYDTGAYQAVLVASDGLACQLQDVPRAFEAVRDHTGKAPAELAAALAAADEEIQKRKQGSDTFASQLKHGGAGSDALRGGVLLALNSSWDAAALGPHVVFPGNTEWIVETVRHLLDHTEAPVIVRQHPAERLAFARTTDDYRALLASHFGAHPRLHFIAAEDPINSYALLERVAAVVVHTSTIGTEAAAFGRPVITGSNAYYSGLGFVWRADTLEQYRNLLVEAAAGRLQVNEAMRQDARLCFYVTQCCNWVFSPFNPADYGEWSRKSLEHWRRQPTIQLMLRSLLTNTPVAALNHLVRVEAAGRPPGTPTLN
ncbi:MAG: hypothetical protein HYU62_13100 [Caulobacterales bacterium]|nr:hypothetical protein [Caulobacterales bacterium]